MADEPIFISYSHRDRRWLDELQNHLKPYIRNRALVIWDDTQIVPGAKWKAEIEQALNTATVAILLVSPNYLASDFIHTEELTPLLQAAERRGLRIVWVAVSASAYKETLIAQYQAVNDPARPMATLTPPRRAREWVRIGEQIKRLAGRDRHVTELGAPGDAPKESGSLDHRTEEVGAPVGEPPILEEVGQTNPSTATPDFYALTSSERRVLAEIAAGLSDQEIADKLGIGRGTARAYVGMIMRKLRVPTRAEAVARAFRDGLL